MTEETKGQDFSKLADDIKASLNESFDSKFSKMDEKIDEKFSAINKKEDEKKSKEDDDFDWESLLKDEDEDEREYISKKDFQKLASKILTQAEKIAGSTSEKIITKRTNEFKERDSRDSEAFSDFPMLNRASSYYDKEFYDLTVQEVQKRKQRGRDENDPDLLYDSAASVKARSNKWNNLDDKAREETRQYNNTQGSFNTRSNSKNSKPKGPSEYQKNLAKNIGLSEEALEKHFKTRVS